MRTILKVNQIETLKEYTDPECYARLHANRHVCCKVDGSAYLLAFHYSDIHSAAQRDEKICIYCSEKDLIYVCDNKRCNQFAKGIDDKLGNFRQLVEFLFAMTDGDVYELEKMEDKITGIEDGLLTMKNVTDGPEKIIALRLGLLKMKRYYEQLSLVTSELAEDDGNIIPDELQNRFAALDRRIDHLLNSVLHLREYTTQVREAYQAQIDIEQNQIMKVFTVISAIFLPLTLIVGWYGMNVQMPEYGWEYGYLYVIMLSVIVCAVTFILLKIKKWF
jgi:magnesium transporter